MKDFKLIADGSIAGLDSCKIELGQTVREFIVFMHGVTVPESTGAWQLHINDIVAIPFANPVVHDWGGAWQWHGTYIDNCWEISVTSVVTGDFDANKNGGAVQHTFTQMNFRIIEPAESLKIVMSAGADNAATKGGYRIYVR